MNVARWSAALASSSSQETPLDYNSFAFLRLWRVWIPVVSRYESFGRTRDVERFNPRPHVAGDVSHESPCVARPDSEKDLATGGKYSREPPQTTASPLAALWHEDWKRPKLAATPHDPAWALDAGRRLGRMLSVVVLNRLQARRK